LPQNTAIMTFVYNLSVALYLYLIKLSALLENNKAKLWLNGRKDIFKKIHSQLQPGEKRIWFHAASLGEFEQGRPVIEKVRELYPHYKIVLTFFSPSGYEIRKDYPGADYIFYLPMDSKSNALEFIDLVQPSFALFIKYEFWYHYIKVLNQKQIPLFLISANFRKDQHFFSWYGKWFRTLLGKFDHIFVQNCRSYDLLKSIGINQVTIAGDTRFDRVFSIVSAAKTLPAVETFVENNICLIAGSTWEPDEELLVKYINETNHKFKVIIAPHEIKEQSIQSLIQKLNKKAVRYSQLAQLSAEEADVLIIDNIGMLSSLYRYGKVAYIGGGFGKGIHNILEAATFRLPVLFGPNYQKFQEANDLVKLGGAFPISNYLMLKEKLDDLLENIELREKAGIVSGDFVKSNLGATDLIIKKISPPSY